MAKINFGGVDEQVVTRKEFSMTKARKARPRRPLPNVQSPIDMKICRQML